MKQLQSSLVTDSAFVRDDDLTNEINQNFNKIQNLKEEIKETNNFIDNIPRSRRVKLPNGEITKLTEETYLTNVKIIAGKKCQTKRGIDIIDWLSNEYKDINADPKDWSKRKGKGFVDFRNKSKKAEIHWFEALGQRVKLKVKRWLYES